MMFNLFYYVDSLGFQNILSIFNDQDDFMYIYNIKVLCVLCKS